MTFTINFFTTMTGIELFILIGGCYALYTVGMAIATELDYRASNQKRDSAYDSLQSGTQWVYFDLIVVYNKYITNKV